MDNVQSIAVLGDMPASPTPQLVRLAETDRARFFERALDTAPVGVVVADRTGRLIYGNALVETMVRHPVLHSDDVDSYGEWVSFHADGRRVESHEYPLSRVLRDGEVLSELDVHYQRGDGTRFWMRIIGRPVHDEVGALIGAAVALVDIDRERQLLDTKNVLIGELNHRVKNAFGVVKAIVSQSLRSSDASAELRMTLDRRLDAYAQAHSRLLGPTWERTSVGKVAQDILAPLGNGRIHMKGSDTFVPLRHGLAISMAFYELATNAWKHGALSNEDGRIDLTWGIVQGEGPPMVRIRWSEHGGPPVTASPRKGFGYTVLKRAFEAETSGRVVLDHGRDGLSWTATVPLAEAR